MKIWWRKRGTELSKIEKDTVKLGDELNSMATVLGADINIFQNKEEVEMIHNYKSYLCFYCKVSL